MRTDTVPHLPLIASPRSTPLPPAETCTWRVSGTGPCTGECDCRTWGAELTMSDLRMLVEYLGGAVVTPQDADPDSFVIMWSARAAVRMCEPASTVYEHLGTVPQRLVDALIYEARPVPLHWWDVEALTPASRAACGAPVVLAPDPDRPVLRCTDCVRARG